MREVTERYGITYSSPSMQFDPMVSGEMFYASGYAVGPTYFAMHALEVVEGRGLEQRDSERLAPVAVISQGLADAMGISHPSQHPVIELRDGTELQVVGFISNRYSFDTSVYVMAETYVQQLQSTQETSDPWMDPWDDGGYSDLVEFAISVPPEQHLDFARRIVTDLRAELPDAQVQAFRIDAGAYSDMGPDPGVVTTIVLGAVSVAILALGALSLINIAVVTVRFRIREFGIRRAFGASQRRIFLSVMMESVVGTSIAGVIGVGIVAVLYRSPLVHGWAADIGLNALPSFPVEAAVVGILTSIATGVLAGMIPALIAVRSKVIDAIRF